MNAYRKDLRENQYTFNPKISASSRKLAVKKRQNPKSPNRGGNAPGGVSTNNYESYSNSNYHMDYNYS